MLKAPARDKAFFFVPLSRLFLLYSVPFPFHRSTICFSLNSPDIRLTPTGIIKRIGLTERGESVLLPSITGKAFPSYSPHCQQIPDTTTCTTTTGICGMRVSGLGLDGGSRSSSSSGYGSSGEAERASLP